MEQVRLHESATMQSVAGLQEAMGATASNLPKFEKARRGKRGDTAIRRQALAVAAAEKAAAAGDTGNASSSKVVSPQLVSHDVPRDEESSSSSENEGRGKVRYHSQGTKCARCMENGINTPASLCGYTGAVLCLACTQQFL